MNWNLSIADLSGEDETVQELLLHTKTESGFSIRRNTTVYYEIHTISAVSTHVTELWQLLYTAWMDTFNESPPSSLSPLNCFFFVFFL